MLEAILYVLGWVACLLVAASLVVATIENLFGRPKDPDRDE